MQPDFLPNEWHGYRGQVSLANPGKIDCVMIEVQTGDYVGEDDIVRLEDNYGRC